MFIRALWGFFVCVVGNWPQKEKGNDGETVETVSDFIFLGFSCFSDLSWDVHFLVWHQLYDDGHVALDSW